MGPHKLLCRTLCLLLLTTAAVAAPDADPLAPLDLSSPRATLSTFFSHADATTRFIHERYWRSPDRALARELADRQAENAPLGGSARPFRRPSAC